MLPLGRTGRWLSSLMAEAALVVALYVLYSVARLYVEGTPANAVENTLQIVDLERRLGLYHELSMQRAAVAVPGLMPALSWLYVWSYLPAIVGAALLIYVRDRELYARYRTALFVAAAFGLLVFAVMPVAPPRLMPELGFVDTTRDGLQSSSKNDFAAVPSFHFGFTLLAGIGLIHAYRLRAAAPLALLPAAVMLLAIVATANHFFLDAVAGGVVVLAALGVSTNLPRFVRLLSASTRRAPRHLAGLMNGVYRL